MNLPKINMVSSFVVTIFILLFLWLLLDKFSCNKPAVQPIAPVEKKKVLEDQQLGKKFRDSLMSIVEKKDRQIDSLKSQALQYKRQLSATLAKASKLASDQDIAKENKDTVGYVSASDSLGNIIAVIQEESERKDRTIELQEAYYEAKITDLKTIISSQDSTNSRLLSSFNTVSSENIRLGKDLNKYLKRDSRKFSFGVGAAYGIGANGIVQPVIGIVISRRLFNF